MNATILSSPDRGDTFSIKERLREVWMSGDFGRIARSFSDGAARFVAEMPIGPGIRVLDVGCGTGNQSIPAAVAGAEVTGVDIAPNLILQARNEASRKSLNIRFDQGDAEDLPYPNSSFDVVLTMFGAMFAPFPERVTSELFRVCRPGGLVMMANWTPTGFVGEFFKATTSFVPASPPLPSPLLWGDERTLRLRLKDHSSTISCARRSITLRFPMSPAETVEHWKKYYGPACKTFAALDATAQVKLRECLVKLFSDHNLGGKDSTRIDAEYLAVAALRIK